MYFTEMPPKFYLWAEGTGTGGGPWGEWEELGLLYCEYSKIEEGLRDKEKEYNKT